MRRANVKGANGLFYENRILLESIEDYNYYREYMHDAKYENAMRSLLAKKESDRKLHNTSRLADLAEIVAEKTGQGGLLTLADISSKVTTTQLRLIMEGKTLVVNENGGYFYLGKDDVVEEINFRYTEKDIKVTKFEGGRHWYAKVGAITVEDFEGDKKWNTHKYAYNEAKKFLEKLNSSSF